jgi:hypothetical protein
MSIISKEAFFQLISQNLAASRKAFVTDAYHDAAGFGRVK